MLNLKVKYKNAWLLGSEGGIGSSFLPIVQELSENVCSCDVKPVGSEESGNYTQVDCSNVDEITKFSNQAVDKYGNPELLVIAAGYVSSKDLDVTDEDEIDKIYMDNFKLVTLALKAFFEHCDKDVEIKKNIIIVSSNAGLEARPNQPVYAAMKSAINSLARSQAAAWGKYNIRINVIAPGTVAVPRNIESLKLKLPNFPFDQSRPLGKIAQPEDLHSIFSSLLDPNLLATGQIIVIDSGSSLN
jgi:3-oxoacyl-[acyl-carrier protein] reductase/7-alpha-hydroxysteroid dehydrogenase